MQPKVRNGVATTAPHSGLPKGCPPPEKRHNELKATCGASSAHLLECLALKQLRASCGLEGVKPKKRGARATSLPFSSTACSRSPSPYYRNCSVQSQRR